MENVAIKALILYYEMMKLGHIIAQLNTTQNRDRKSQLISLRRNFDAYQY